MCHTNADRIDVVIAHVAVRIFLVIQSEQFAALTQLIVIPELELGQCSAQIFLDVALHVIQDKLAWADRNGNTKQPIIDIFAGCFCLNILIAAR